MKKKVLGGDRIPNYNPTMSEGFKKQSGKGRPRGRRNRATIERERSYAAGYAQALRDLQSAGADIGRGKTGSSGSSGKSVRGNLQNLMENPAMSMIASLFGPGALVVSGIAGQWMAEETLKLPYTTRTKDENGEEVVSTTWIPYPPILHSIFELIEVLKGHLTGADMTNSSVYKRASAQSGSSLDEQVRNMQKKKEKGEKISFWDQWAMWSAGGQTSIMSGAGGGW